MRSLIVALSHLPETKDAAAANGDARLAHVADRLQSVFIGPVGGSQCLISPVVCNQRLLPVTEQAAILQCRSTNELQRALLYQSVRKRTARLSRVTAGGIARTGEVGGLSRASLTAMHQTGHLGELPVFFCSCREYILSPHFSTRRNSPGGDHRRVKLPRRVQVVVVRRQSSLLELLRLLRVDHSQGSANLHTHAVHFTNLSQRGLWPRIPYMFKGLHTFYVGQDKLVSRGRNEAQRKNNNNRAFVPWPGQVPLCAVKGQIALQTSQLERVSADASGQRLQPDAAYALWF